MKLSLAIERCQGRYVRSMGQSTLANGCFDCLRRTSIPADMQAVQWMQPPKMTARWWPPFTLFCPSHIGPSDDEVSE